MKGKQGRGMEGRGRASSYLELLSSNLLERRQERYKQTSQTDSFWLWGEWDISYLLAKWHSVLIVHNTATTLQRPKLATKSKKILLVLLSPFLAISFKFTLILPPSFPAIQMNRQKHWPDARQKIFSKIKYKKKKKKSSDGKFSFIYCNVQWRHVTVRFVHNNTYK